MFKTYADVHSASRLAKTRKMFIETENASVEVRKKYRKTSKAQDMLGAGQYGNVWLFEEKSTNKEVAIKVMEKGIMTENEMATIKDEIGILACFDHVNIVKHLESYEDANYIYIVMEFI